MHGMANPISMDTGGWLMHMSSTMCTQAGACAVLTGVMAASEEQWQHLVLEKQLVKQLCAMLEKSQGGLRINLLAALTSAAQGGDPGGQAVCNAGTNPLALCTRT